MKTMCPPGYHRNGFVAAIIYIHIYTYICIYINIYIYISDNVLRQMGLISLQ